jgi:sensor domain CHASE-containing protein
MNISRKVIIFIKTLFVALASLLAFSAAFAQDPAAFVIDIQPASFDTNTSVDMTIKAIDANGDVLKDYQ